MEGQAAISSLLRRFPDLRLADDPPRYRRNFNLRGLESLVVAI
jgi:cytochrome P450